MPRKAKAVAGGKITTRDEVEEIFEKRVVPDGNCAKIDAQKKQIGKRVYAIILKG